MLPIVLNKAITLHTVRPDFGEVLLPWIAVLHNMKPDTSWDGYNIRVWRGYIFEGLMQN